MDAGRMIMKFSFHGRSANYDHRRGGGVLERSIWGSEVAGSGAVFPVTRAPAAGRRRRAICAVSSVLTSDIGKDALAPFFNNIRANAKNVAAIILGGGAGTKLFPLTSRRAEPAVPIGGSYRLIDIPMSNCINSGINKIYVMTQFNSWSLNRHLARTYNFGNGVNFGDGFVEVLAATQTPGEAGMNWFQGTADAVRQFIWVFEDAQRKNIEHVLILCGDQLYRMDYMDLIKKHTGTQADITVSCVPMVNSRASDFGLMKIDQFGRIVRFSEKPKGHELESMKVDTTVFGLSHQEAKDSSYIASMGVYAFRLDVLLKLLRWRYPTSNDFGSEIIPSAVSEYNVRAHMFHDYWEDIGTIKSFFDANLALAKEESRFQFHDPRTPFYTSPRHLPPTKMDNCKIKDSFISHGCFLDQCNIQHSIIGDRSRLEFGVEMKDAIVMGADFYQTEAERAALLADGKVPIGIGQHSRIQNCIVDKNARIGKKVIIANSDRVEEADRGPEGFYIRSGIVILLKNCTIKDGTVI
ncbi:glucose-1-phosphate adenylyltransferase large subunit 1-like isoform X2 [Wolffia australiana]